MADNHYVLASGDDWEGLYLNGVVIQQGHEVTVSDFADTILANGGYVATFTRASVDLDWLSNEGWLPTSLGDVKFEDGQAVQLVVI
jgi:hypothetical protein